MTVGVILSGKGSDVVTAEPNATLRTIAEVLSRKKIGAIMIVGPDRQLLGIISERDIVHAVARKSGEALDEPVSAHMTSKVVTATADMTVGEAMTRMTEGRFRHLPVVRSDRLEGVVSIGDLVKFRLSEMENENRAMLDYISAN